MSETTPAQTEAERTAPTEGRSDRSPAVAVDDLTVRYSDGTVAVDGVSLTVPCGQCFGFLGPNGAGKTTTIKVLATLLRPTRGSVTVNGFDAVDERAALRGSIGYMAQETSIDRELTARENLRFACASYGVPRGQCADRIDDLLELVGLADVADTPAAQFSGGMAKRLDAATALVHDPALVFLDEPTTGLDPTARNRLWEHFRRINEAGTTIFLTTQYLEEADALCDRLAVIRDGSIVADGSPDELKRRVGGEILEIDLAGGATAAERAAEIARGNDRFEADAAVETTEDGIRVTTKRADEHGTDLLVALRGAGLTVTGFGIDGVSLDDVFLAIADEDADDFSAAPAEVTE